jgi:hypothetical protein
MAFNLELLKTKVSDFLHTVGSELGPWVHHLEEGFHNVAAQVHVQAVADEKAAETVVAGAVNTVEQQVTDDITTATEPDATPAPVVADPAEPASAPSA